MPLNGEVRPDPKVKPVGKTERVKTTGKGTNKPRRIIDPPAVKLAALANRECAACGESASNGDHFLPKDKGGDDVEENIIGLCGTGTMRCHGAKHGSPYLVSTTNATPGPVTPPERRDQEWVMQRIGRFVSRHREDAILYVLGKLGDEAGRDWLLRTYWIIDTENGWESIA